MESEIVCEQHGSTKSDTSIQKTSRGFRNVLLAYSLLVRDVRHDPSVWHLAVHGQRSR